MAIDEIILHVGMHKTGTTSIQMAFDGYDDGEIAYADLKIGGNNTPNHGPALETIFRTDFENVPHHKQYGRSKSDIAQYRKSFRAKLLQTLDTDRRKLVFCGEAVTRLSPDETEEMRDMFFDYCDKVTIIAYIREPLGFCASMFQQRCRVGAFFEPGEIPGPRYRGKFRKFIRLFGRKNVQFVHYDPATMVAGSSVNDFAQRVGFKTIPEVRMANSALSEDATKALYILGQQPDLDFKQVANKRVLRKLLPLLERDMAGAKFRFLPGVVEAKVPTRELDWMEKVTGFDLRPAPYDGAPVDVDASLREVSETGQDQLRRILDDHGVTYGNADTFEMLIRRLFNHLESGGASTAPAVSETTLAQRILNRLRG